ncbi:hypothetical protein ACFU5O_35545 [Streptomyces sp. NPDC057445]|uniref:hypothetical protein n=1 Tax=Streptomyces sp. NPDC057445 TaxID=3346136 RepID=UPI0036862062
MADTIGDAAETAIDWAQGGLGWTNGWLCRHASVAGCRIGIVALGGLSGALEGLQDITDKGLDIVKDVGGLASALMHCDPAACLSHLADIFLDTIEFCLNNFRFFTFGTIYGGMRDAWQAAELRRFVEDCVNEHFAANPPQLALIRQRLGLDGVSWGLPDATNRVFRLDSASTPLWEWHEKGIVDLYAMAGLLSIDSFTIRRPRTVVRSVNDDGKESGQPISRWTLARYIDSDGMEGRIRVYALAPTAVKDFVQVSVGKCKELGIKLSWPTADALSTSS